VFAGMLGVKLVFQMKSEEGLTES